MTYPDTPDGRLPEILWLSIQKMQKAWEMLDNGVPYLHWDCDYCELQSDINCAEVDGLITPALAWTLREKYLRMRKEDNSGPPRINTEG